MPSKELGREIRTALKVNPGKVVLVQTNGTYEPAKIYAYYPKTHYKAQKTVFENEGVFYGRCMGRDTWGAEGHYFADHHPAASLDLVKVIGVVDA